MASIRKNLYLRPRKDDDIIKLLENVEQGDVSEIVRDLMRYGIQYISLMEKGVVASFPPPSRIVLNAVKHALNEHSSVTEEQMHIQKQLQSINEVSVSSEEFNNEEPKSVTVDNFEEQVTEEPDKPVNTEKDDEIPQDNETPIDNAQNIIRQKDITINLNGKSVSFEEVPSQNKQQTQSPVKRQRILKREELDDESKQFLQL
jgi:hypothetical protein